jgi:hypothetical protein
VHKRLRQIGVFLGIAGAVALCIVMLPLSVMPDLAVHAPWVWYLVFAVGMGATILGGLFYILSCAFPRGAVRMQAEKPKVLRARRLLGILQAITVIAAAFIGAVWLLLDALPAGEDFNVNLPHIIQSLIDIFANYSVLLLFALLLALAAAWLNYSATRKRDRK